MVQRDVCITLVGVVEGPGCFELYVPSPARFIKVTAGLDVDENSCVKL